MEMLPSAKNYRAASLPSFVNADWVGNQVIWGGAGAAKLPKWCKDLAQKLSESEDYPHWGGEEDGEVFKAKFAEDLAIVGFGHYVMEQFSAAAKSKFPFRFIRQRFEADIAAFAPKGEYYRKKDILKMLESLLSSSGKFQEYAFYCALCKANNQPDFVGDIADIARNAEDKNLADFLDDYRQKLAVFVKTEIEEKKDRAQKRWRQAIADIAQLAKECPDAPDEAAAEKFKKCAAVFGDIVAEGKKLERVIRHDEMFGVWQKATHLLDQFPDETFTLLGEAIAKYIRDRANQERPGDFDSAGFLAATEEMTKRAKRLGAEARALDEQDAEMTKLPANLASMRAELRDLENSLICRFLFPDWKSPAPPLAATESPPLSPPVTPKKIAKPRPPELAPVSETELREKTELEILRNKRVGELDDLVAALLRGKKYAAAAAIAKQAKALIPESAFAFPPSALALLAITSPFFDIANQPEESDDLIDGMLEELKFCESDAARLTAFAALLAPVILDPKHRKHFGDAHLLPEGKSEILDSLRAAICRLGEEWIGLDEVREADDGAALRELLDWREAAQQKTIKYAPATHVWQNWVRQGANDDDSAGRAIDLLSVPNTFCAGASLTRELIGKFKGSDKDIISHFNAMSKGHKDLEGSASQTLCHEVKHMIGLMEAALAEQEKRPHSDVRAARLADYRVALKEARDAIRAGDDGEDKSYEAAKDCFAVAAALLQTAEKALQMTDEEKIKARRAMRFPDVPTEENEFWDFIADPDALTREDPFF